MAAVSRQEKRERGNPYKEKGKNGAWKRQQDLCILGTSGTFTQEEQGLKKWSYVGMREEGEGERLDKSAYCSISGST